MEKPIRVLLVEDNPDDARLIQELLAESGAASFQLDQADRLAIALEYLAAHPSDIILLDLSLPDSQGLDTFLTVSAHAPDAPIVILTGLVDEKLARQAVGEGAQDYLMKGDVDSRLLVQSIRYAIERNRLRLELLRVSLRDELTGLYNRRGFMILAEQHYKVARHTQHSFLLMLGDLDGLKSINDNFGHPEGDAALRQTAAILRRTFRASDVLARLGGDEFIALVIDAEEGDAEWIISRLQENLSVYNARAAPERGYRLSLSFGVVQFDPVQAPALTELIKRADKGLYEHKRGKRQKPITGKLSLRLDSIPSKSERPFDEQA